MSMEDLKGISIHQMAALIPLPDSQDNKYSRGVLTIIGGAAQYPGAAALAAQAGQRMGAGYTKVWCAPESVADVRAGRPSLVVRPWDDADLGKDLIRHEGTVVVGPGFTGKSTDEQALLKRVLEKFLPTVVDGGALTCLANLVDSEGPELLRARAQAGVPLILTPHGGEALCLVLVAGEMASEQAEMAQCIAEYYYATVVLKGPQTVIWGEGAGYLMKQGTAALAKAGTGDVLAGIVGALLCQGVSPVEAGCLSASIHAHAGHLAAQEVSMVSVTAEDVIVNLPRAIKDYLALRGL